MHNLAVLRLHVPSFTSCHIEAKPHKFSYLDLRGRLGLVEQAQRQMTNLHRSGQWNCMQSWLAIRNAVHFGEAGSSSLPFLTQLHVTPLQRRLSPLQGAELLNEIKLQAMES